MCFPTACLAGVRISRDRCGLLEDRSVGFCSFTSFPSPVCSVILGWSRSPGWAGSTALPRVLRQVRSAAVFSIVVLRTPTVSWAVFLPVPSLALSLNSSHLASVSVFFIHRAPRRLCISIALFMSTQSSFYISHSPLGRSVDRSLKELSITAEGPREPRSRSMLLLSDPKSSSKVALKAPV